MGRGLPRSLLAVALAVAAPLAQAQLYVCTDARGRTITGDRPPPECADRAVRELRSDGSVRRVIEPPLTAEQKAARDAEVKRQREEAEKQRAQMRRDLALLETYASEAEIEDTRNRALGSRQQLIDRAIQRLADHQKERKKLDIEAEFYARRQMPDKLKRAFDANAALMRSEQKIIDDVRADMDRVNARFDAELKRWRDLVTSGALPVQRSGSSP
jgi:hypothetical protein